MMMMMMTTTSSTTTGTVTTTMRGCARRHGGGGGGRGRGVGAMPRRTGARGAIDDGGGGWRAPCRARALARGDDDSGDGGDASSSSSYALDEMLVLKTLREAYDASSVEFASIVRRSRTALTLSFFSACEARGEALRARGAVEDAEALDAMCGAAYAMASYTLEEITEGLATSGAGALGAVASDAASDAASKQTSSSFSSSSSSSSSSSTTTTGLTLAQENELRARWGELTKALATTGESNALAQGALNEESRKNAITEIAGRVSVGAGEMERLMRVAPERRIVDVLLTIPRGDERAAAVNDALTPPEDGDDVDGDEENEVVFTTAPKLLNVLEAMRRDARAAGEDATLVAELDELAAIVESKCEYL